MIVVDELTKQFKVPVRDEGLRASTRSLFRREHRLVAAVNEISFTIQPGEIVGFLGPNGAGKTTTLKMFSGILNPTGGTATVLGHRPFQRRHEFLRRIALIMGNRSQLDWDLPAADSFRLQAAIYDLAPDEVRATRDEIVDLLDLGRLLDTPARNLSLGERMKFEIALSLLHDPAVIFLDEPTLGLDLTMQRRIRSFLAEHNRRRGTTMLLTSHYMADVEALCERVIVIDGGRIRFDGALTALADSLAIGKTITIEIADGAERLATAVDHLAAELAGVEVLERSDHRARLRVARRDVAAASARLLSQLDVTDFSVEDPPIDEVIERTFTPLP